MSWYRKYMPQNGWEGLATVTIAVASIYIIADAIKARNEEWKGLCYKVRIAADRNGDGELDPNEWCDLRQKAGFQGDFKEGIIHEPSVERLEYALRLYERERRERPQQITSK